MRPSRALGATVTALVLGACASGSSATPSDGAAASPSQAGVTPMAGEQVFHDVCSQCHTLEPPPNLAPPMRMVSRHLRERFGSEDEAVGHVVSYVRQPTADASILPPHAIQRFGLMPPQPLPEAMLEAVGRYVWSLSDGPGAGMGMGRRGPMHGRRGPGMQPGPRR